MDFSSASWIWPRKQNRRRHYPGLAPLLFFTPNYEAFAKFNKINLAAIKKDGNKTCFFLAHHVIADKVMLEDMVNLEVAKAMNGHMLTIAVKDDRIMVNGATILRPDIVCSTRSHSRH